MKNKFVTSADVAKRAGVSRSAVSRTFTPGAYVSPDVRKRVLIAAEEMGYRINRLAKDLLTSRSSLVAIVGANLSEPFIAALLDALSAALIERGLHTLLLNAGGAGDMTSLMNLVLEYRVRAVVVLSGAPPAAIVEQCHRSNLRMILINREANYENVDMIETDDLAGGRLAAEHLLDTGCRKLAVVRNGADTPSQRRRAQGFSRLVEERGLSALQWSGGDSSYEAGCIAARALLADHAVDGVFCVTDRTALGFLNTARFELKVSIPEDIGIVGFDDIPEAAWPSHALTTIRQPIAAFVDAVISSLEVDRDHDGPVIKASVPVTLVQRGTTRSAS